MDTSPLTDQWQLVAGAATIGALVTGRLFERSETFGTAGSVVKTGAAFTALGLTADYLTNGSLSNLFGKAVSEIKNHGFDMSEYSPAMKIGSAVLGVLGAFGATELVGKAVGDDMAGGVMRLTTGIAAIGALLKLGDNLWPELGLVDGVKSAGTAINNTLSLL